MTLADFLDRIEHLSYQAEADLSVDPIAMNSIRSRLANLAGFVGYLVSTEPTKEAAA